MYSNQINIGKSEFPGCNGHEIAALQSRHDLEAWIKSDALIKGFFDDLESSGNELFNQTFMDIVVSKGGVKKKEVCGSK